MDTTDASEAVTEEIKSNPAVDLLIAMFIFGSLTLFCTCMTCFRFWQ